VGLKRGQFAIAGPRLATIQPPKLIKYLSANKITHYVAFATWEFDFSAAAPPSARLFVSHYVVMLRMENDEIQSSNEKRKASHSEKNCWKLNATGHARPSIHENEFQ
jgi:hypothetical protein